MGHRRRVAITGLGIVSAIGCSLDGFWDALAGGATGIGPLRGLDTSALSFGSGAQVSGFVAEDAIGRRDAAQLDIFAQYALAAAQDAVRDAGLAEADTASTRCGVMLGAGLGGQETLDDCFKGLYRDGARRANPATIPKIMPSSATSRISMRFGATGPSYTMCTACSSSNHAIGNAFWLVRSGLLDVAITGGSDAPFSPGNLLAWSGVRVISADTCRPFSVDRSGMILGEGSGILVLEAMDAALDRGARVYGEIVGFGMSADAHHVVIPSPRGAVQAMQAAIDDGGLRPDEVDHINAHGTGTPVNDRVEAEAVNTLFGAVADAIAVTSTKGAHGHGLGAAGALEAVATVLTLDRQSVPPTANFHSLDPDCRLDVVTGKARKMKIGVALSNSFAFGGLNAVLALRSFAHEG